MFPFPTPSSFSTEYSFLYLPAFAYGFLYSATEVTHWSIFGFYANSHHLYLYSMVLSVVGGLMYHRVGVLIFGRDSPSKNPKTKAAVVWSILEITTGLDANKYKRNQDVNTFFDLAKEIGNDLWGYNALLAFFTLIPISFVYLSLYFSPLLLFNHILGESEVDFITVAFLVVLLIVALQSRTWSWFPNYSESDNLDDLSTPEYKKYQEQISNHNQTTLKEYNNGD
ncbi:hypothetical protein ACLI4U_17260 [Natrialbaceae archaeon A-CW2]